MDAGFCTHKEITWCVFSLKKGLRSDIGDVGWLLELNRAPIESFILGFTLTVNSTVCVFFLSFVFF